MVGTGGLRAQSAQGAERSVDQVRDGPRASGLHDRGAMIFDRAPADAEIGGDILARMTS